MNIPAANAFVICAAVLHGLAQPAGLSAPTPIDAASEPHAYAIYATVLQRAWKGQTGTLLLQQETEDVKGCAGFLLRLNGEWAEVGADFERRNTRQRTLQPALPMNVQYRLVRRADIQADDARLAKKYPGVWQMRPETMDFAAVSVVGFNRERTKAMLYAQTRRQGGIVRLELKDGEWVDAPEETCGWVV